MAQLVYLMGPFSSACGWRGLLALAALSDKLTAAGIEVIVAGHGRFHPAQRLAAASNLPFALRDDAHGQLARRYGAAGERPHLLLLDAAGRVRFRQTLAADGKLAAGRLLQAAAGQQRKRDILTAPGATNSEVQHALRIAC